MKRIAAIVALVSGVGLAAWILWPSPPDDDEALLKEAVTAMARGASEKDLPGVLDHVSETYKGEGGTRQELKRYLFGYVRSSEWVSVVPTRIEIVSLEGTSAEVTLVALMLRGPAKDEAEVRQDDVVGAHRIDARFEKEDGEWRVVGAKRRAADLGELF